MGTTEVYLCYVGGGALTYSMCQYSNTVIYLLYNVQWLFWYKGADDSMLIVGVQQYTKGFVAVYSFVAYKYKSPKINDRNVV